MRRAARGCIFRGYSGAGSTMRNARPTDKGIEMNRGRGAVTGVLCAVLAIGCASHPDPIIDMMGVDDAALESDWEDCAAYSDQVIIAGGAAKGAAGGAVVGAATGAIGGNADAGAGYGAIWGATRSTLHGDREKQMVFKRCLRGRGYRVLN
jgi:outer membrane lipoprotein SlyB